MTTGQGTVWKLNPGCELHWRHWDEGFVLFDAASGRTHLLNPIGAACLQLLALAPTDGPTLWSLLRAECALDAGELPFGELEALLADFGRLGLVEREAA